MALLSRIDIALRVLMLEHRYHSTAECDVHSPCTLDRVPPEEFEHERVHGARRELERLVTRRKQVIKAWK